MPLSDTPPQALVHTISSEDLKDRTTVCLTQSIANFSVVEPLRYKVLFEDFLDWDDDEESDDDDDDIE